MYKSLYKLESRPFEPLPDPSFLWLGGRHKEALSILQDGILDNLGFVLLAGAAGTGKTTLVNDLTRGLKSDVVWAVISYPSLERIDFYNEIGRGFGIDNQFISKVQFLIQFSQFLYRVYDAGKKVVLFVDDCHLLSQEILDELHVLSDIEKNDAKLIDIFFVGRLEFYEKLAQPQNKLIRQRLGLKAKLVPFGSDDTADYIKYRLKISGSVEKIFTASACQVIHQYSEGVPRVINVICKEALQVGSVQGKKIIDHNLILKCVKKLKFPVRPELSDLRLSPVEEKQVEYAADKVVLKNSCRQNAVGLISRRRKIRNWLFCIVSFLVFLGLGAYFLLPQKDIPVMVEDVDTVAGQDMEIVSVPLVTAVSVSEVVIKEDNVEDSDTVVDVQKVTERRGSASGKIIPGLQPGTVELTADEIPVMVENVDVAAGQGAEVVSVPQVSSPSVGEVVVKEEDNADDSDIFVDGQKKAEPKGVELEKIILGLQPGTVELTVDADRILIGFIKKLLQYPGTKVLIKGFVSSNNDSPENSQLSRDRAEHVRKLLIKHGVAEAQIEVKGMGIQDPIATNDTPAGRLKNRRVEIEVINNSG